MKDNNSLEDIIRNKMDESKNIPSDKVWQELSQMDLPQYPKSRKLINMKNITFLLAGIPCILLIMYGYNFIKGNNYTEGTPLNTSFNTYVEAVGLAEKEGKFLFLHVSGKIDGEDCSNFIKVKTELDNNSEIKKLVSEYFIKLEIDIDNDNYQSFFDTYRVNDTNEFLFFKDGQLKSRLNKTNDPVLIENWLSHVATGKYEGTRTYKITHGGIKKSTNNNHNDDEHGYHGCLEHGKNHQLENLNSHSKNENIPNLVLDKHEAIVEILKSKQEKAFEEHFGHPLKLKAYPNPNNGNFKLDIEGAEKEALLLFSTLKGDVFLKEKIEISPYAKTLEYDLSNQSQAVFLLLKQGDHSVSEKIIIQK